MKNSFELTIRTRDTELYRGPVVSVTSQNDDGRFDVLSNHANFITILRNNLIYTLSTGEKKEVFVERGLLRVIKGKATVFLGFRHS